MNRDNNILRKTISEMILNEHSKHLLSECIVVAGQTGNQNVIAKTRDRNYKPKLKIIRTLFPNGTEVVCMHDQKTKYLEGMNSHGIGILNSTLMVYEDENPVEAGTQSDYGKAVINALMKSDIQEAIAILCDADYGIEGHTMVANADEIYVIERTGHHDTVLNKLDPSMGFDVRTNHGLKHKDAGYTMKDRPKDYVSSKIRQATAETNLVNVNNFHDVAKAMLSVPFKKSSNLNTLRRTDNLRTSSQIALNLPTKEFVFYIFPNECEFKGIEEHVPENYEPKINIKIYQWNERN